ncbi:hypothetical protein DAPPUDRAFT_280455, partial [Daphnia pulex]
SLNIPPNDPISVSVEVQCPMTQMVKGQQLPFSRWSRKHIKAICFHPPPLTKRHPMQTVTRDTHAKIKTYINKTLKPLLSLPAPIQADVWWRIQFRMLPVSYKFVFMQNTNPRVLECSYPECVAVETMKHVLYECRFVNPVWRWHQGAWRVFGVSFAWTTIENLDEFQVAPQWSSHLSIICRLWVLLVAGLLRDLWIHRNKSKFENKPVPYIKAVTEVSMVSWSANVRRWIRDPTTTEDDKNMIQYLLQTLQTHENYAWFWLKYPRAFTIPTCS